MTEQEIRDDERGRCASFLEELSLASFNAARVPGAQCALVTHPLVSREHARMAIYYHRAAQDLRVYIAS